MRYIQITWNDYLTNQKYWDELSNTNKIALHIGVELK